jgi:hypothetical protein
MSRARLLLAGVVVAAAAILLAACSANESMVVHMNPDGSGTLTIQLALDPDAQAQLGFAGGNDPEKAVQQHFPWVVSPDSGWSKPTFTHKGDQLVITTSKSFASADDLKALVSEKRSVDAIAGSPDVVTRIPDLPHDQPLLNDFSLKFTPAKGGDKPSYTLFTQGGVGDVPDATCSGDKLLTVGGDAAQLRRNLHFVVTMEMPRQPRDTSGETTPSGAIQWRYNYGDCPRITADTAGSSSGAKTLNGAILAVASGFILVVLGLRALRRRRGTRA